MKKEKLIKLFLVLTVITLINAINSRSKVFTQIMQQQTIAIPPEFLMENDSWADSVLTSLNLDEKIAQFFILPVYPKQGTKHINQIADTIAKYSPGGVIFFQGGPHRQVQVTNLLQEKARTPLLVSIDGEWGLAMRLDSVPSFPRQMMLGAVKDEEVVYRVGKRIGEQMNRVGVNVNFAPVVDVNNNAKNPVINSRSFGENPANVSSKSILFMTGLQDQHVLATAKHFPGHGDTDTDSHKSLPVIPHDRARLDSIELKPFKDIIRSGAGGVMVAHLYVPVLDSTENRASSLSPFIVSDILKGEIGFKGLVFTDALNMGGVSKYFSPGEADFQAFLAGNDILLMPRDFSKAVLRIKKGVRSGEVSEEEIDLRCKKILMAKKWLGLNHWTEISETNLLNDLNTNKDQQLIKEVSDKSITVLQNSNHILPLKNIDELNLVSLSIGTSSANKFTEHLDLFKEIDHHYISKNAAYSDFLQLLEKLPDNEIILLSLHGTSLYPTKSYGITSNTVKFIDSLLNSKRIIFNYFGNPYGLNKFKNLAKAEAIVLGYQDIPECHQSLVEVLFGAIPAQGILPVGIHHFPAGTGEQLNEVIRLSYGFPEEVGMSSLVLSSIDTIVENAIAEKAMPGCQVLVARKGKVVLQKSYGYHTYQNKSAVKNKDLYDLASITKIAATLPMVMQMYARGDMDIEKPLSAYLPAIDTTNKADLIISDILYHEAGLKAWIPFYISTLENMYPNEELSSNSISEQFPYQLGERYFLNKHIKYKDNFFSHVPDLEYPVQVADGLFGRIGIQDTVFKRIYQSDLRKRRGYKYSDLGFYLLYKTIQDKYNTPFNQLVDNHFYKKLGANRLCYLPLEKFSKNDIIPTENDIVFRRQLVHGYVHDPGAAMLGGVSGHAGLFANANDLAKLMQMYLNEGQYGGTLFIPDTIFENFTHCHSSKNRRGMGFDKPELNKRLPSPVCESASPESFGHTGFTGTITWVDPKDELVFIFLSNRVHPDALNAKLVTLNVRTNIQQVVYNAIVTQ